MNKNLTYLVEVKDYSPTWPKLFSQESEQILSTLNLNDSAHIEHIGSTAITGMTAKPIIDMLLLVDDVTVLDRKQEPFTKSGYHALGEFGIPGRRYFYKERNNRHTYHLHAFEHGHLAAQRHLFFRDYLQSHPDKAAEYAQLKQQLATIYRYDIESYVNGKADFVTNILNKMPR